MPARWALGAAVLVWLLSVGALGATVRIKAPLQDHYRPGRYVPLHVSASGIRGQSITLWADHMLPVRIAAPGGIIDTDVPLLPLGTLPSRLEVADTSALDPLPLAWHAMGDDERLIGLVGIDSASAPRLFPAMRVHYVSLDSAITGTLAQARAWETLDALVVNGTDAARLDEGQLSVLLAGGTALAVRSDARPAGAWPWAREGAFWILRFDPIGPRALNDAGVYQPTYGWVRGFSGNVRARAVAAALLFVVLATLLTLKRFTGASVVFVIGCGLFCVVWIGIDSGRARTIQLAGEIQIDDGSLTQTDAWTWDASLNPIQTQWIARGCAHPFLASRVQVQSLDLQMRWDPAVERLAFEYALSPGRSIALLKRSVAPTTSAPMLATPGAMRAQNSFLYDLFNRQYANAETDVVGTRDGSGSGEGNNLILVARRSKP